MCLENKSAGIVGQGLVPGVCWRPVRGLYGGLVSGVYSQLPSFMGVQCVLLSVMAHRVVFAPRSTPTCLLGNQSAVYIGVQCGVCVGDW